MPIVFVKLTEGKSEQQKKAMSDGITRTIMNVTKLDKSFVKVGFEEFSALNTFGELIYAIVHTIEGKSKNDKQQMVDGIVEAIVDGAGVDKSVTRVGFLEYPMDSYAIAGVLFSDR